MTEFSWGLVGIGAAIVLLAVVVITLIGDVLEDGEW